jgi:hypothetical protein
MRFWSNASMTEEAIASGSGQSGVVKPSATALEVGSRMMAGLIVALYVLGYLIVSLRDASYGFSQLNPLRPRILSAGVLFLVSMLAPYVLAHKLYSHRLEISPEQSFSRSIVATFNYAIICTLLAVMAGFLLSSPMSDPMPPPHPLSSLYAWTIAILPLIVLILVSFLLKGAWARFIAHPMPTAAWSGVIIVAWIVGAIYVSLFHAEGTVALWLFSVGVLSAMVDDVLRDPVKRSHHDYLGLSWVVIAGIFYFSNSLYTHVKPSWGGGAPLPVSIYFSNSSQIAATSAIDARLLDESDQGYYFLLPTHSGAIFVPRASVAALSFSGNPLPAEYLSRPTVQPNR